MSLCPHQASTVLVCLWTCVVWKVFGTGDDGIWSHSWSPTRLVDRPFALVESRESWYVDTVLAWWSLRVNVDTVSALVEWSRTRESHEKPRQDATGTMVDTVLW